MSYQARRTRHPRTDWQTRFRKGWDQKTKPPGSLGYLEDVAVQVAYVQDSMRPTLANPVIVVFAGDHGLTEEGVSAYPAEVTSQMVLNFISGGAAINCLTRTSGMDLMVVDAGVRGSFSPHRLLLDRKVAQGTRNLLWQPAMTRQECAVALELGRGVVQELACSDLVGFGEMGIGNTSAATLITSRLLQPEPDLWPNGRAGILAL